VRLPTANRHDFRQGRSLGSPDHFHDLCALALAARHGPRATASMGRTRAESEVRREAQALESRLAHWYFYENGIGAGAVFPLDPAQVVKVISLSDRTDWVLDWQCVTFLGRHV
jgi:hypothetical protein